MSEISKHLESLETHIQTICEAAGRDKDEVKLIAVSKTRSLDEVEQAINVGQCCFGENTLQDAMTKIPKLHHSLLEWHFIGQLQSKKSKAVVQNFKWLHTLDSLKLAQKLSKTIVQENAPNLNCLIQLNLSEEVSKSGLKKDDVYAFVEDLLFHGLPGLNLRGLMTIGVQDNDTQTAKVFEELRNISEQVRQRFSIPDFDQLSMGMSNDYAIAIREGATMIRVGTTIFGKRR